MLNLERINCINNAVKMHVLTGNFLRMHLSAFYVPDDDIIATNDMYIRGELDVMFGELNLPLSRSN